MMFRKTITLLAAVGRRAASFVLVLSGDGGSNGLAGQYVIPDEDKNRMTFNFPAQGDYR